MVVIKGPRPVLQGASEGSYNNAHKVIGVPGERNTMQRENVNVPGFAFPPCVSIVKTKTVSWWPEAAGYMMKLTDCQEGGGPWGELGSLFP